MRPRLLLAALALVGAGCRESSTEPYTPTAPAPSGLAASLGVAFAYGSPAPGPAIAAAGDSLVATAVLGWSGCVDYAAQAGREGGAVVVTVVQRPTNRFCNLDIRGAAFRVVVRPAPVGRYDVVLRARFESPQGAPSEREVVRRSVTLR